MCFAARVRAAGKGADKRADEEMRAYAARDTIEKAYKPPQECRAHEAGRCIKGDRCFESHNIPDSQIKCCSVLVFGQNHYHKNFRMCASSRVNRECQYSHEPLVEPLEEQAEATQADLFDSLVEAESEEYRQLLSGGAVSAASAGVANSGGTAHPTAPADGPADQVQIASERQANEAIEYYESANPMGQTEEAMPQAELPHSTVPPPAA